MNIKYRRGTFSKYEMLPVRGKILYILRQSFAARIIIFYSPVNIKYRVEHQPVIYTAKNFAMLLFRSR